MASEFPSVPDAGPIAPRSAPGLCSYCGNALDGRWYFCLRCATPWQDEDRVVSPARPLIPTTGMLVRERAPGVLPLFWTYASVILVVSFVAYAFVGEDRPHVRMILLDGALLVTTCVVGITHGKSLLPQLSRFGFDRKEAWIGLLALGPLLGINWAWHKALSQMDGAVVSDMFEDMRRAGFSKGTLIGMICVFPALNEEIAFRGLLQHWLHIAVDPRTAIGLAAGLFAAVHFSLASFPTLFLAGILLGWVKWKTGSLYPSILIHFLHNLVVLETFRF